MLKKAKTRIELDIEVDYEFYDYLFDTAKTELEFCESRNKLVLYTEYEIDLPLIQGDIEKILRVVERINEVYKTVGDPWQALEILKGQGGVAVG